MCDNCKGILSDPCMLDRCVQTMMRAVILSKALSDILSGVCDDTNEKTLSILLNFFFSLQELKRKHSTSNLDDGPTPKISLNSRDVKSDNWSCCGR